MTTFIVAVNFCKCHINQHVITLLKCILFSGVLLITNFVMSFATEVWPVTNRYTYGQYRQ